MVAGTTQPKCDDSSQVEYRERVGHPPSYLRPVPPSGQDLPASATDCLARIAELEAEVRMLREENARADQVLRSAIDYAIITMDGHGRVTGWNDGARRILGHTENEVLGRSGELVFTPEDRNQGRFILELRRALETGKADNERWHVRRDGSRFWASGLMMPLLGDNGEPSGFLNILRDRSEAQAQEERRELLMAEMNHRVKNTFAMVQAVASLSCRHSGTMADFQASFASRLAALAQSHDMLIKGGWEDAPLREVIEAALGTYCDEPGRATIEGEPVLLAANTVVAFTLTFHELATNAAKHGALSARSGTVHVSWRVKPASKGSRQVELVWRERGGPPVRRPERQGFGSHLLSRGLGQLDSSLRLDFQPDGLECHICFPTGAAREVPAPRQAATCE